MTFDIHTIKAQQKLNNQADVIELPKAFTDKFPDMKAEKAQELFQRYLHAVSEVLLPRLPWLTGSTTYISTEALFNKCRDFNYKKERYYVWNEFKDIYPFFYVLEKGSNLKGATPFEKNSKVELVQKRFITMLLQEKSPKSVVEELFPDLSTIWNDVEKIEIDVENLQNFIHNTEYEMAKIRTANLDTMGAIDTRRAKLEKNLWQAIIVQKIGEYTETHFGRAVLPMIPNPSPFGRIYYKGLSIQNVTKQVRGAIIGPHYQYDMNAAVYGVKLALFNNIVGGENNLVGTALGSYTREYLLEKNSIRERLANYVFDGVAIPFDLKLKNIKNALTAIGFGAKTTQGFWIDENEVKGPALTQIIMNKDARERFLNDPWVAGFIAEQETIEEAILEKIKNDPEDPEYYSEICEAVKAANGKNGRATKSLILAYIYQNTETSIMDIALEILNAHNIRVIARIHDAFITMAPVPVKVLDEIYMSWSRFSSHLALERDEVKGWIDVDFKKALDEQKAMELNHRAFIKREEYKAKFA